jgi:hypothetical protein
MPQMEVNILRALWATPGTRQHALCEPGVVARLQIREIVGAAPQACRTLSLGGTVAT